MPGFLLDTNHVYDFYRHQSGSVVVARMNTLPSGSIILGSAVCLGEIASGHRMQKRENQEPSGRATRDEFLLWLNEKFVLDALNVTPTTAPYYAELMGRIWDAHPPGGKKQRTELHLLRSGADHKAKLAHLVSNGVDVNDVWAVALAWEFGLTFVTRDKMFWVREAAGDDVKWDCWLPNSTPFSPTAVPPPSER